MKKAKRIVKTEKNINESKILSLIEPLKKYLSDDESFNEIKKYLNYVCSAREKKPFMPANIIIKGESSSSAVDFLNRLQKVEEQLSGISSEIILINEDDMLDNRYRRDSFFNNMSSVAFGSKKNEGDNKEKNNNDSKGNSYIVALNELITTDLEHDEHGKKTHELRERWKRFCKKQKDNREMRFAICTDYDTANRKFNNFPDVELTKQLKLFYNYSINLKKKSVFDISHEIIKLIKKAGFHPDREFNEGLAKKISEDYPSSGMSPEEYVEFKYNVLIKNIYETSNPDRVLSDPIIFKCGKKHSDVPASERLNRLVGLQNVKKVLKDLELHHMLDSESANDMGLHFVFSGNPGTGKTMVAGLMAELLFSMGIIKENKIVEVSADQLLGMYLGEGGRLVRENCKQAYGGILFIDEAYAMDPSDTRGNTRAYREEGLSELIKEMENNKDKLVVIFAGYKDEMDSFMRGNPGLKSRIYRRIEFEDYSEEELIEIFKRRCKNENFLFSKETLDKVREKIHILKYDENFGNARTVINILHDAQLKALENKAANIREIEPEYIEIESKLPDFNECMKSLMSMTGLQNVKKDLSEITSLCKYNSVTGKKAVPAVTNMLFTGNPGTGKTTVAKLYGNMLFAIGAVAAPKFVSINAYELNSSVHSGVSENLKEFCKQSMGGVLFIDEAYALGEFGAEGESDAISTLLDVMENNRKDLVVILAGYEEEMNRFLSGNPGLKSRIPTTIHFADYSLEELEEIFVNMLMDNGFEVSEDALEQFKKIMEAEMKKEGFANARTVRNFFEHVYKKHAVNYINQEIKTEQEVITKNDIPYEYGEKQEQRQIGFM